MTVSFGLGLGLGLEPLWTQTWLGLEPLWTWTWLGLEPLWTWTCLGLDKGGLDYSPTLKQLHEGGADPGVLQELRTATDLALRAVPGSDDVHISGPGAPPVADRGGYEGVQQASLPGLPDLPGWPIRRSGGGLCPPVLRRTEADGGVSSHPAPAVRCSATAAAFTTAAAWSWPQESGAARLRPCQACEAPGQAASLRWATQSLWILLFRRWWPHHSFPRRRAGWRIFCFLFVLFRPKLQKRAVSFSSGSQEGEDGSARDPVSTLPSPSPFVSGQQGPVRGRDAFSRAPCPAMEPDECRTTYSDPTSRRNAFRVGPLCSTSLPHRGYVDNSPGPAYMVPGGLAELPRPSCWLLRTIRLGYAIQYARRPPKFRRIRFISVLNKDAPVLRAEVAVLLAKDAIEPVPPAELKSGFYSPYFIVPKKGGGLRPILDLHVLNRALHKLPFRMLTQRRIIQCLRPFDLFAAINLKDAYFHVSILPRHRPFSALRSKGEHTSTRSSPSGYPCPVSSTVVRTQGYGAQSPQPVGASGQPGKEQTLPYAEDLFSQHGVGLGQPHSTSLKAACSVNAEMPGVFPPQEGGSTETFSEAPGANGILSYGHTARIASYETASALVSRPGPEMGMAPRHVPGLSHPVLPPHLQPMVGPCFLWAGVPLEQVSRHVVVSTDASTTGWGGHVQWACSCGALDRAPAAVAYQLPRVAGSMACSAPLQNAATREKFTGPYGQHCDRCVHQPPRRSTLPSHVATRRPSPPLESEASEVASRRSCSWRAQSCSRRALTSARPSGRMTTPPRGIPADLETLRGRSGRPVCLPGHVSLPAVFLPVRGDPRYRCAGMQLASGPMQICVSPSEPSRTDPVQGQGGRGASPFGGALLAQSDLVPRTDAPRDSPSLANSSEEGSPFSEKGHPLAPASELVESPCMVPGRDAEVLGGLPPAVVNTITSARALSTRHAYRLKWNLLVDWCSPRREDPRRCLIAVVLSFLQDGLERRLSPSTLKVYVAAIAAHHDAVDGKSVGKHDLVIRFLRGARRLKILRVLIWYPLGNSPRSCRPWGGTPCASAVSRA